MESIKGPNNLSIYHQGPDLNAGALPAFFYFALAGDESLIQDPYNQPVKFLSCCNLRIFSLTLPFHGPGFDPKLAVQSWTPEALNEFLDQCHACVAFLIEKGYIDTKHISAGGLSRGAFIATHLAARNPDVKIVLGFAPMTQFPAMELNHLIPHLIYKKIRYYIGNHDLRVGTEHCFSFIKQLADTAYEHGIRSPQAELIISPSVGHKGHGTLSNTFLDGANWLKTQLDIS